MHKFIYIFLILSCIIFFSCQIQEGKPSINAVSFIPKPNQLEVLDGTFTLNKSTTVYCDEDFNIAGDFLAQFIEKGTGFQLKNTSEKDADIVIKKDSLQAKDGYSLVISGDGILINASDAGGAFYAIQTLRQSMPFQIEKKDSFKNNKIEIPQLKIKDAPAFKYRGMHLDVGRHLFSAEFIKKYIANLAMLKMNYFHWHLTEDQGWRIEIKQYPKLAKHAAYRSETLIGHYNDTPQKYDGKPYGGFYTQDEIKEIVAFAAKHNVTIIPEIEMPGHSQAALSAYPELGCTGAKVSVATKWGVFPNIYCPNEQTFTFLENVLTEVMDLFPGDYIHIGGDEAPKTQWKKCNHCQNLIKELDLKDENGLQSYFITRMEQFINSKGKKIIGWDEILEGGLAPNATVMSWRGTNGAIEAAKEGHEVILTPISHAYFDYYQSNKSDEPLAIGGFLPLKKVYSFNPIPKELNKEESKFVLGAQGNVWTEYMKTEEFVEYMVFPRILAMSEVTWSGATADIELDYPNFISRVEPFLERLNALDINYANHLYEVEGKLIKENENIYYQLTSPSKGIEIKYSIDGTEVSEKSISYLDKILLTENTLIKARGFKNGDLVSKTFEDAINFHKAIKGRVNLNVEPHKSYNAGGKEALINGISGSNSRYGDKEWLGFWGDDVEITIDLGKKKDINKIKTRFFNAQGQWIYAPKSISIKGFNDDKSVFMSSELIEFNPEKNIIEIDVTTEDNSAVQFLVITIPNFGIIPEGKQGAGNKAWTFIDELIIE